MKFALLISVLLSSSTAAFAANYSSSDEVVNAFVSALSKGTRTKGDVKSFCSTLNGAAKDRFCNAAGMDRLRGELPKAGEPARIQLGERQVPSVVASSSLAIPDELQGATVFTVGLADPAQAAAEGRYAKPAATLTVVCLTRSIAIGSKWTQVESKCVITTIED